MLTKMLSLPLALAMFLVPPGGWLGVELDDERPLAIKSVVEGSPAAKAGIRRGDVFVAVNGRRVRNEDHLLEMFDGFKPRQKIKLTMKRGDRELEFEVTLAERPEEERRREESPTAGKPYLGIDIDVAEGGGLHVAEVRADGPAAAAGVRSGDVITGLNDQQIRDFRDLDKMLGQLRPGAKVVLSLRRGDRPVRKELVLGAFPGATARAERQPRRQPRAQPRRQPRAQPRRQPRAQPRPQPRRQPGQPRRPADDQGFLGDYQGGLAQARRSGKPVVLVFGASWCEACHTLRKSFEHASLKEPLAGYVCIWLDTDREGRLADRHDVQGLPHIEILDSRGERLAKMVGHQTPEALRAALQRGAAAAKRAAPRQPGRQPAPQPDRRGRRPAASVQQLQRELDHLRQQLRQLQREQAQQRRQLQEILRRLRDR